MIVFEEAANKIKSILEKERILYLNETNILELIDFCSNMCFYEEEENKIHPKVIIGNDLDFFFQQIPSIYIKEICTSNSMFDFKRKIKPLLSICEKDWFIFINIFADRVFYGVCKLINDMTIMSIEDILTNMNNDNINFYDEKSFIILKNISKKVFRIWGFRETNELISFEFINKISLDCDYEKLSETLIMLLKNKYIDLEYKARKNFYERFFSIIRMKVHGCICLIVDEKEINEEVKNNCIFLNKPIDFMELYTEVQSNQESSAIIKLKYNVEMAIELISNDGISIFNNEGKLIGYNYFVKSDGMNSNIIGGARKRAYNSIIEKPEKWLLGAYFQSQDGNVEFKEIKHE